jgi:Holliday junction DNA helicase RuvA
MIVTLEGLLREVKPLQIIVELNGIGYEISIPLTTTEKLPSLNTSVKLHIQAIYREDQQTLYGFIDRESRDFFRLIIEKVSGVGPKTALGILSRLSLTILKGAIKQGDVTLLSKCPGIGKKSAERLIIELKDKIESGTSLSGNAPNQQVTASDSSSVQDAVAALIALGIKLPEADKSIRKAITVLGETASPEALIKYALSGS